jgi:hypothetical protein
MGCGWDGADHPPGGHRAHHAEHPLAAPAPGHPRGRARGWRLGVLASLGALEVLRPAARQACLCHAPQRPREPAGPGYAGW